MHSQLRSPFVTLDTYVPVITQAIGYHVACWIHLCATNRNPSIIQCLYLILSLIVPEVHASIRSSSHEPSFIHWVETNCIHWIKNRISSFFVLVTLESYDRFLYKKGAYWVIKSINVFGDWWKIGPSIYWCYSEGIAFRINSYRLYLWILS